MRRKDEPSFLRISNIVPSYTSCHFKIPYLCLMITAGNLIIAALLILLFNVPFGYWRANVSKLGWQWFLAVHIPVIFVVFIRFILDTGWHWSSFVFFISSYFLGHLLGGYLYRKIKLIKPGCISSCLVMDIFRSC